MGHDLQREVNYASDFYSASYNVFATEEIESGREKMIAETIPGRGFPSGLQNDHPAAFDAAGLP